MTEINIQKKLLIIRYLLPSCVNSIYLTGSPGPFELTAMTVTLYGIKPPVKRKMILEESVMALWTTNT